MSLRQALRESFLIAPPLHAVGARVAVAFQNRKNLFTGSVTACSSQPSGRPLYCVNFDDGEVHDSIPEEELRPEGAIEAEERVSARHPADTEVACEQAHPPPNLPD